MQRCFDWLMSVCVAGLACSCFVQLTSPDLPTVEDVKPEVAKKEPAEHCEDTMFVDYQIIRETAKDSGVWKVYIGQDTPQKQLEVTSYTNCAHDKLILGGKYLVRDLRGLSWSTPEPLMLTSADPWFRHRAASEKWTLKPYATPFVPVAVPKVVNQYEEPVSLHQRVYSSAEQVYPPIAEYKQAVLDLMTAVFTPPKDLPPAENGDELYEEVVGINPEVGFLGLGWKLKRRWVPPAGFKQRMDSAKFAALRGQIDSSANPLRLLAHEVDLPPKENGDEWYQGKLLHQSDEGETWSEVKHLRKRKHVP